MQRRTGVGKPRNGSVNAGVVARALVVGAGLSGCIRLPDPPPAPEDLSELSARYEHPTAEISEADAAELYRQARDSLSLLQLPAGLHFVRTAISDTNQGLSDNTSSEDLTIQGAVRTTLPCTGFSSTRGDASANGSMKATLGVQWSRIRRGFEGELDDCRFTVNPVFAPEQHVVLSGDLLGDLGEDLGIGSELSEPTLVQLRRVVGSSTSDDGRLVLDRDEYDFRLTAEGDTEALVDPSDFGLNALGSVVLVLRSDGTFAARESRGVWGCEGDTGACKLVF